jgi:CTP:molybdopterin cytidylyltransferase MocA
MSNCLPEVVILAGGASARMGESKALLHFCVHETFLDHILQVYRAAGVERAVVVWPKLARHDLRVQRYLVQDSKSHRQTIHEFHEDMNADRLTSVIRGLRRISGSSSVFLQDVDRPFITVRAIQSLLEKKGSGGYTAPDTHGHAGHPLLLSPQLVFDLRELDTTATSLTLREVLLPYPFKLVQIGSAKETTLLEININTPAEYRRHFPATRRVIEHLTA